MFHPPSTLRAANRSAHRRMHETGWPGRHSVEPFGLSCSSTLTSNGSPPRGAQFAIVALHRLWPCIGRVIFDACRVIGSRLGTSHGIALWPDGAGIAVA